MSLYDENAWIMMIQKQSNNNGYGYDWLGCK